MDAAIRKELAQLGDKNRFRFSGEFIKYGYKNSGGGGHFLPTILLGNVRLIRDDKAPLVVTSHLWFNLTKGFKNLGILIPDETVSFNGRVAKYKKGYEGTRTDINKPVTYDYDIIRPTKIKLEKCLISDSNSRTFWSGKNWQICNKIYEMYSEDYLRRNIFQPYTT